MRSDIPEGLSDSPFAREIGVGDVKLRFRPELEAQYQRQHLQRTQLRVRVWFTCMATTGAGLAVAAILSMTLHIQGLHVPGITDWIHIAADATCLPLLVGLAWNRRYEDLYLPVARIVVPVYVGVATLLITQVAAAGSHETLAWITLFIMATYFFSGILFRAALVANIVAAAAFVAVSVTGHIPVLVTVKSVLVLATTSVICAIACRDAEQTSRRRFLEAALLADYSTRDGLTGLQNRRAFDEHLLRVWQLAQRTGQSMALLMIDIDHFKAYNDTYGHQAGDAAIRSVGQALREFARRPLDLAARYGGEEFSLILFDLSAGDVQNLAEHVRRAVASVARPSADGVQVSPITISIGIALVTPMIDRSPQGAIQLADEALYEAKAAGRDRSVLKGLDDYRRFNTGSFRIARTRMGA